MPSKDKAQIENARRNNIIQYILEHDGCLKQDVIEYMRGTREQKSPVHSALATTIKIIEELVGETVIVKPDEKNSQKHHLHINDKFKIISNQLDEIKKIMDLMNEPIRRIIRHQPPISKNDQELSKTLEDHNEKPTNFSDLYDYFLFPYEEAVFMMLRLLFIRINGNAISEIDANTLKTKIIRLMNRLSTQIYDVNKPKKYLDYTIEELKSFRVSTTKTFAKNHRIDIGLRPKLIQIIEDFQKNFLV